jgi:hypothetical protein
LDVPFSKTALAQVGFEACFLILFIVQFLVYEGARRYVGIVLWGALLLGHLPTLYDLVIKRSFATRIPLNKIKSVRIEEDNHGLHTHIILYLENSSYVKIPFRKLENQYQPLVEAIYQYLHSTQYA